MYQCDMSNILFDNTTVALYVCEICSIFFSSKINWSTNIIVTIWIYHLVVMMAIRIIVQIIVFVLSSQPQIYGEIFKGKIIFYYLTYDVISSSFSVALLIINISEKYLTGTLYILFAFLPYIYTIFFVTKWISLGHDHSESTNDDIIMLNLMINNLMDNNGSDVLLFDYEVISKTDNNRDEECPICLELLFGNDNINRIEQQDSRTIIHIMERENSVQLKCNHMYHKKCIDSWLHISVEKNCPKCRSHVDFNQNLFHLL